MPTFDMTITISVILAICAIISPVITTLLNNKHQLKLKKLDIKQVNYETSILYKRKIFEDYLRYTGQYINFTNGETSKLYGNIYYLAYMYSPSDIREGMSVIDRAMSREDIDEATIALERLSPVIEKYLLEL